MAYRNDSSHFCSHFIGQHQSQTPPNFQEAGQCCPNVCLKGEEEEILVTILSDHMEAFYTRHRCLWKAVPLAERSSLPTNTWPTRNYSESGSNVTFTGKPSCTLTHPLTQHTYTMWGWSHYSLGLTWPWAHLIWFYNKMFLHMLPWQGGGTFRTGSVSITAAPPAPLTLPATG